MTPPIAPLLPSIGMGGRTPAGGHGDSAGAGAARTLGRAGSGAVVASWFPSRGADATPLAIPALAAGSRLNDPEVLAPEPPVVPTLVLPTALTPPQGSPPDKLNVPLLLAEFVVLPRYS